METTNLKQLKEASSRVPKSSFKNLIQEGETNWYVGVPIETEKGFVGLKGVSGVDMIIREDDILEVAEKGGVYSVRISIEANIIARMETVIKADPNRSCSCDEDEGKTAERQKLPPWLDINIKLPGFSDLLDGGTCTELCLPRFKCVPIGVTDSGKVYKYCYLTYDCTTQCSWPDLK